MYLMGTALHQRLDAFAIDHVWRDYGSGCHCWPFWHRDLRELLPVLMDRFAHPAPVPSPFSYTSIDPTYEMYGWTVTVDRPALEFSRLGDAGPVGLSLTGSGSARVRTAPEFSPGQPVAVTITDGAGTARSDMVADGQGRLTVPVSLGPGNPLQQYTAAGTVWALATGAGPDEWPAVTARVRFEPGPAPSSPPTLEAAVAAAGGEQLPATGQDRRAPLLLGCLALAVALGLRRHVAR
jgi:hypothetical protein